jgi:hypothetical protein
VRRRASRVGALISVVAMSAMGFGSSGTASAAGSGWTPFSPLAPTGAATVFDGATGQLLTYDGAKTWSWDGGEWTQVGSPLPLGAGLTMVFDVATHQVVLTGVVGLATGTTAVMQTWTWNGARWTQQHPTAMPPSEWAACAGYDAATGQLIMFGGTDAGSLNPGVSLPTSHDGTWNWTGSNWLRLRPSTSPPGGACSMAYDPDVHALVLATQSDLYGNGPPEIWLWDGNTWTRAASALPTFADLPSLAFDPEAGGLVAYTDVGHVDPGTWAFIPGGYENETWGWNGTVWSMLGVTTPETKMPYDAGAIAFDPSTHQLLLHDGGQFMWGSAVASVE